MMKTFQRSTIPSLESDRRPQNGTEKLLTLLSHRTITNYSDAKPLYYIFCGTVIDI